MKLMKLVKSMKSSQADKTKLSKSCAYRANFFRYVFSSIYIEGPRTILLLYFCWCATENG